MLRGQRPTGPALCSTGLLDGHPGPTSQPTAPAEESREVIVGTAASVDAPAHRASHPLRAVRDPLRFFHGPQNECKHSQEHTLPPCAAKS